MFALGIDLLMRRAIITRWDNREEAEWPPHPDRVFMALVAAWGESSDPADSAQREALEWLESLGAPSLTVPRETSRRASFTSYVPVNDDSSPVGKKGSYGPMGSLPIGRNRQPRMFPAVVPDSPMLFLTWNVDVPSSIRPRLEEICGLVTYVGHSASPVRMWIEDHPPPPDLLPNEDGATHRLRTFGTGRLDYLKNRFAAGLRPQPSLWQGYAPAQELDDEIVIDSPFDPALIILRQQSGRKFSLESAGFIANAIRATLMQRWGQNPPEWLSGHSQDGSPSKTCRLSYVPLGFVSSEHADGHLLGMAIAIPRNLPTEAVEQLFQLLFRHGESSELVGVETGFVRLWFQNVKSKAKAGEFRLELDERRDGQRPLALQVARWTKPARSWATVTPVLLPRYPRRELTVEAVIAKACVDAGLPEPVSIQSGSTSFLSGVPHARSFKDESKPNVSARPLIHVKLEFPQKLRGPVLMGAGRFPRIRCISSDR